MYLAPWQLPTCFQPLDTVLRRLSNIVTRGDSTLTGDTLGLRYCFAGRPTCLPYLVFTFVSQCAAIDDHDGCFVRRRLRLGIRSLVLILSCCNNNNGRNGSCLTWLATSLEEKRRWLVINASPRGQCSK